MKIHELITEIKWPGQTGQELRYREHEAPLLSHVVNHSGRAKNPPHSHILHALRGVLWANPDFIKTIKENLWLRAFNPAGGAKRTFPLTEPLIVTIKEVSPMVTDARSLHLSDWFLSLTNMARKFGERLGHHSMTEFNLRSGSFT